MDGAENTGTNHETGAGEAGSRQNNKQRGANGRGPRKASVAQRDTGKLRQFWLADIKQDTKIPVVNQVFDDESEVIEAAFRAGVEYYRVDRCVVDRKKTDAGAVTLVGKVVE